MITIANFLSVLSDLGVTARADGDTLRLSGRTGALTPDQIEWLKQHKAAVMAMLRLRQNPVRRWISLDGEAEAFSSHALDPAYWRLAEVTHD